MCHRIILMKGRRYNQIALMSQVPFQWPFVLTHTYICSDICMNISLKILMNEWRPQASLEIGFFTQPSAYSFFNLFASVCLYL
jgi:hypothetical protein